MDTGFCCPLMLGPPVCTSSDEEPRSTGDALKRTGDPIACDWQCVGISSMACSTGDSAAWAISAHMLPPCPLRLVTLLRARSRLLQSTRRAFCSFSTMPSLSISGGTASATLASSTPRAVAMACF